jgi:hypothetical protein
LLESVLERSNVGGRQRCARDLGQRRPRPVELRVELQRLPVFGFGSFEITDELQRGAEVVVVPGLGRVARHGAAKRLRSLGVRAGARHDDADRVERQRVARVDVERALRGFERFAGALQREQAAAAVRPVLCLARRQRNRAIDDFDGLGEVVVLGRQHAEQEQRIGVFRLGMQDLEAELVGEAVVAPIERALRFFMPLSYHAVRLAPTSR